MPYRHSNSSTETRFRRSHTRQGHGGLRLGVSFFVCLAFVGLLVWGGSASQIWTALFPTNTPKKQQLVLYALTDSAFVWQNDTIAYEQVASKVLSTLAHDSLSVPQTELQLAIAPELTQGDIAPVLRLLTSLNVPYSLQIKNQ